MDIYVGNISRTATEQDIKEAFEAFGAVSSAAIIKDKFSGESRGFGFVEMPNKDEADKAISGLNGKDLKSRALTVNEAKPRTDRPRPCRPPAPALQGRCQDRGWEARPRTGGPGGGRGGFGGGGGGRGRF